MVRRRIMIRKKRQNRAAMALVMTVVLMLLVVVLYNSIQMKAQLEAYKAREASLTEQIEEEKLRTQEIEEFEKYSDIVFYSISSETDAENCISYFGRLYQVRYLSGLIAGSVTETNNIGYVANTPNNEINRGINAFTLGVKAVNPKARVIVKWVGSWDDKQAETDAVNSLIEEYNIDLVTHHQNQNYVVEAAEKAGIYSIGNNGISGEYSEKYLTSVGWNWLELYKKIIREFIHDKSDKDVNHWFGIETGAVVLSELSEAVDEETRDLVSSAEEKIKSGKDVFSGVIYDNNGNQQCDTEEIITDETLLNNMDWFVEGVEIYE